MIENELIPWAFFGAAVFFGTLFAFVSLWATLKARRAVADMEAAREAMEKMKARAEAAEGRLSAAVRRAEEAEASAQAADARSAGAQNEKARAIDEAADADERARLAAEKARLSAEAARLADAELQNRRAKYTEDQRKAASRASSLLSWATQQWEARREEDRRLAQEIDGTFQVQLDAYLGHRRVPIIFEAQSDIDRFAAPLMEAEAVNGEKVKVEGDQIEVVFSPDPALGFRA